MSNTWQKNAEHSMRRTWRRTWQRFIQPALTPSGGKVVGIVLASTIALGMALGVRHARHPSGHHRHNYGRVVPPTEDQEQSFAYNWMGKPHQPSNQPKRPSEWLTTQAEDPTASSRSNM